MSNDLVSRFINGEDERLTVMDDFEIPLEWWSRPFEYAWASKFLAKEDIIIDAGCGINHPFKDYASKRVRKCFAIDADIAIKDFKDTENLMHIHGNICDLKEAFEANSIDKIFCISVLEHMHIPNIIDTLTEFKRVLKQDGLIILTIDHPHLSPESLIGLVDMVGLQFFGSTDFAIDKNKVLKGSYANLKCYRVILCKPETEIKPDEREVKPIKAKSKK